MRVARGFSVLEVMIAGAVFLIGMLAMLPLLTFTVRETSRARQITGAQLVGLEVIERLRSEIHWDAANLTVDVLEPEDFWERDYLPHGAPFTSPVFEVKRQDATYEIEYALEQPGAGLDCSGNAIAVGLPPAPANARCTRVTVTWPLTDERRGTFEMRSMLMGIR